MVVLVNLTDCVCVTLERKGSGERKWAAKDMRDGERNERSIRIVGLWVVGYRLFVGMD